MPFYQGRGNLYLAERTETDGVLTLGPWKNPGCAANLNLGFTKNEFSITEKCSGFDTEAYRGVTSQEGNFSMTLRDWSKENVARFVNGLQVVAGSPGTVTDEALPTGIVAGDVWFAGGKQQNETLTTLVITDTTPTTPLTLALGTNYTVDAVTGMITFINVGSFVQPFHLAYGYTRKAYVSILTAGVPEYNVTFVSLNKADALSKGKWELYRVRLNTVESLDGLPDQIAEFTVTGAVLIDNTKTAGGSQGQFGRIGMNGF